MHRVSQDAEFQHLERRCNEAAVDGDVDAYILARNERRLRIAQVLGDGFSARVQQLKSSSSNAWNLLKSMGSKPSAPVKSLLFRGKTYYGFRRPGAMMRHYASVSSGGSAVRRVRVNKGASVVHSSQSLRSPGSPPPSQTTQSSRPGRDLGGIPNEMAGHCCISGYDVLLPFPYARGTSLGHGNRQLSVPSPNQIRITQPLAAIAL